MSASARREHLLNVAADLILSDGFEALTMESLAAHAGVSKGLGYVYFGNAEEVALAVLDREIATMYRKVSEAMDAPAPFEVRVRRSVSAYLDIVAMRGRLIAMLQNRLSGRGLRRNVRARLGPFFDMWSRHLSQEFGFDAADAEIVAAMALSASDSIGRMVGGRHAPRYMAENLLVAFLTSGIRGARPIAN